jgi:hypothetical protein
MPVETKLPIDAEEVRMLESSATWHADEEVAAHQLSHPLHSMLYPEYKRLAQALEALRVKCAHKRWAIWARRQKMRDREQLAIWRQKYRTLVRRLFP